MPHRWPAQIDPKTCLAILVLACQALIPTATAAPPPAAAGAGRVPVILDTDIGDDIDDTWALALLLKCPELDLKLVVGDQGKPLYRAGLIARLLEVAGRTDVAVGVGLGDRKDRGGRQEEWIRGYQLDSYAGTVHEDGVQAIIDLVMASPERVTLIAIGPLPNLKAALEREPRIARNARFVGMHGSVRRGYGGRKKIDAEYNVRVDPEACRKVLTAPWDITITPLDTCGVVVLRGTKYQAVQACRDPLIQALLENYRIWAGKQPGRGKGPNQVETASSVLFDTVAVYLALADDLCEIETLPIRVTAEGKTVIDPKGHAMRVATAWRDLNKFEDLLVTRLTGSR